MKCKICGNQSNEFDIAEILEKYKVHYYCCPICGFVQTEEPYWLDEAYSTAFSRTDVWCMNRNMINSNNLLFLMKFVELGPCLDFGGGYGVLVRMMRDYGFDFYWYDKYAQNIFAFGFDGDLSANYTLVTSFENFEHFVNPMEEIEKIINCTQTVYFTTTLIHNSPPIKEWFYYYPIHGQHISFYSHKTLKYIAKKYSMYLITDNINTHILSKKKISQNFFKLLRLYRRCNKYIYPISNFLIKESKIMEDANRIINKIR